MKKTEENLLVGINYLLARRRGKLCTLFILDDSVIELFQSLIYRLI